MVFHNQEWGGGYNNKRLGRRKEKNSKVYQKKLKKLANTSTERTQSTRVECAGKGSWG
jgi:hypothetical protein